MYKTDTITLTKELLDKAEKGCKETFHVEYKSKIDEFRAREANFSNTLAYVVVNMGYALSFKNRHLKISNSKYHFYFFDQIRDKHNSLYTTKTIENNLVDLISSIKMKLEKINYITVNRDELSESFELLSNPYFKHIPKQSYKLEKFEQICNLICF